MEFMGLVNSAWMHCSREKSQQLRLEKKKKKKAQVLNPDTNKSDPNGQLVQNGNPVLKKSP